MGHAARCRRFAGLARVCEDDASVNMSSVKGRTRGRNDRRSDEFLLVDGPRLPLGHVPDRHDGYRSEQGPQSAPVGSPGLHPPGDHRHHLALHTTRRAQLAQGQSRRLTGVLSLRLQLPCRPGGRVGRPMTLKRVSRPPPVARLAAHRQAAPPAQLADDLPQRDVIDICPIAR
jgi:hypothetical protein